jgi:hypothetical protein
MRQACPLGNINNESTSKPVRESLVRKVKVSQLQEVRDVYAILLAGARSIGSETASHA